MSRQSKQWLRKAVKNNKNDNKGCGDELCRCTNVLCGQAVRSNNRTIEMKWNEIEWNEIKRKKIR